MTSMQYPKGILPVLPVADVGKTAGYYVNTLQFTEVFQQPGPDNVPINAQVTFEGSSLMLNRNPKDAGREGGGIYLWVRLFDKDIDAYFVELKEAGVEIAEDIKDQFWGDRSFVIKDCNQYFLAFNQAINK